jgi:GAF domain-containing protein
MINKTSEYEIAIAQIKAITANESDLIANMANISSILFNGLSSLNWAGFYLYKNTQLVLGPFHGKPACIRIPMGKGVCGSAAAERLTKIVQNVHDFDGHIACDSASNSEVVVPIVRNNMLIGVLDIDSPVIARFDAQDAEYLSVVVDTLVDTMVDEVPVDL